MEAVEQQNIDNLSKSNDWSNVTLAFYIMKGKGKTYLDCIARFFYLIDHEFNFNEISGSYKPCFIEGVKNNTYRFKKVDLGLHYHRYGEKDTLGILVIDNTMHGQEILYEEFDINLFDDYFPIIHQIMGEYNSKFPITF